MRVGDATSQQRIVALRRNGDGRKGNQETQAGANFQGLTPHGFREMMRATETSSQAPHEKFATMYLAKERLAILEKY